MKLMLITAAILMALLFAMILCLAAMAPDEEVQALEDAEQEEFLRRYREAREKKALKKHRK